MSGGRTLRLGDEEQERRPSCFTAVAPGATDSMDAGHGTHPRLTGLRHHHSQGRGSASWLHSRGWSWVVVASGGALRSHAWENETLGGAGGAGPLGRKL